ncbi:L-aspartate oxidase [Laspinema sp. D1]|uniref:L-aspartate oxidase n=1 Tax=Laspinema palackyanum D2a TaxID=2953684 RepID=A0ABT2MR25_9CYAN|nr:L-aspartate oxidase [Laspinema sp. D2a]
MIYPGLYNRLNYLTRGDFSLSNPSQFDPGLNQSIPTAFDVLVVGAGAAGLYSALCIPNTYRVGLIAKDSLPVSASDWAQGGIAAAIASDDSPKFHIEDTLIAGAGLCDLEAVKFLAEQAPDCVQNLLKLGVAFDRDNQGTLALTLEAAHSHRRVLHAADTTGRAIVSVLSSRVLSCPNIQAIENAVVLNLWMDPESERCQGVRLVYQGQIYWVRAGAVVLATGGGGQVFAQTTNPSVSTGDGVAMAWRAGALLRDLEFFQFHPTALTKAEAPRFLISEAVRGEGAHLLDDRGYRFMFDYHPAGELAPRDVVSRSIFMHLQNWGTDPSPGCVWLDLRSIPDERIRHRFPNIIQVCQTWGVDLFKEPIPVAPAAHYWMGGIQTDLYGRTSIPGLYAVGETTNTGVHGANRLASNSLLECLVFGAQLKAIEMGPHPKEGVPEGTVTLEESSRLGADLAAQQAYIQELRRSLPLLVWQSAGIVRGQAALEAAIAQINTAQGEFAALPLSQYLLNPVVGQGVCFSIPNANELLVQWSETRNLLDAAYLILTSAMFRTESRGGHYRLDYPHTDPNWQAHTVVQNQSWRRVPL